MNRLLRLIVIAVIVILAVGFYRGWFQFSADTQEQRTGITVTLDKKKVEEDKEKAIESFKGLEHRLQPKQDGDKSKS
jgi:Na+/H+ antiporter NhaB